MSVCKLVEMNSLEEGARTGGGRGRSLREVVSSRVRFACLLVFLFLALDVRRRKSIALAITVILRGATEY